MPGPLSMYISRRFAPVHAFLTYVLLALRKTAVAPSNANKKGRPEGRPLQVMRLRQTLRIVTTSWVAGSIMTMRPSASTM